MKRFISICQQRLDILCDRICKRVAVHMAKRQHSYQEFVLQDKLKHLRGDNKFLQLQLTKTRADLHELQSRPQTWKDIIYQLLCMPDEQLRETVQLPVQRHRTGAGWETVTGFCCLGGCDVDVYPFQSERDALLFSVILKTVGYQAPHNVACSACYQEYMSETLEGGIEHYAD